MNLPADQEVAARTIGHYEAHAVSYAEGTRDHDVSQNVAALLDAIVVPPPFDILDLGCGPGRDLATFTARGHRAIGLDGAARFVAMARAHSGCDVWQQDFLDLRLPTARFDGVFANAVLFHVPSAALPRVLGALHATLRQDGVLFTSNPRGQNQEGWYGERYAHYCDWARWHERLTASGFDALDHYYRPPGLPCDQQPWLASVWRRRSTE
jgi:SAM-dependent methyltransferase